MIFIEKPLTPWSMLVASIDFPSQRHRREDRRIYTQRSLFACSLSRAYVSMACCAVYCHGGICCDFYYEDGPIFLVMWCVISYFFFVNTLSNKFLTCGHLREKVSHLSKQN